MMKKMKKNDFLAVAICLIPMIAGVILYDKLPDRIATNYDFTMKESGYSSKVFVVFVMPLIFAAVLFGSLVYLRNVKQKESLGKMIPIIQIFFPTAVILVFGLLFLSALDMLKDIGFSVCLIVSLLMIYLGNYMPKIRKNWIIGIRTPHTLKSEELWYRTHRIAGVCVTLSGVVALVLTLLKLYIPAFIIMVASVIIPAIYAEISYYTGRNK